MKLKDKVAFITGGSRGIGREIALTLAREGCNVAIAAKTDDPHPKLPGTIHTVAEEVEKLGVKCMPMKVDVRDEDNVAEAFDAVKKTLGAPDIHINNAGAISLTPLETTPMKRIDLMLQINVRATLMCSKYAATAMKEAGKGGHVLSLSPPIILDQKWFSAFTPYTISKYGMSMATFGLAAEFADAGIAFNSLWPRTTIWTAAVNMLQGDDGRKSARKPAIMADAAMAIFTSDPKTCTGNHFIDETLLRERGVTDFEQYAEVPGEALSPDIYIEDTEGADAPWG